MTVFLVGEGMLSSTGSEEKVMRVLIAFVAVLFLAVIVGCSSKPDPTSTRTTKEMKGGGPPLPGPPGAAPR